MVPLDGEERRFEMLLIVTLGAVLPGKLPLVWIGRMTVGAPGVGDGLFEVAVLVAPETIHFGVRAVQGKLGAAVIEAGRLTHLLPARRVVTALAVPVKCAPVWILVATTARRKRNVFVLHRRTAIFGQRTVAAVARYPCM